MGDVSGVSGMGSMSGMGGMGSMSGMSNMGSISNGRHGRQKKKGKALCESLPLSMFFR